MKATLEFNLPEDKDEHDDALRGSDWRGAVESLGDWMRSEIKYSDPQTRPQRHRLEVLDEVRTKLWEILRDRGLGE